MRAKVKTLSITLIIVIGLGLFLHLTLGTSSRVPQSSLPLGAEQVIELGNGWVEFSLDGRRFMFFRRQIGNVGMSALTELRPE